MNNKNEHWSLEEPWMIRQAKNMKQNITPEEFEELSKSINDMVNSDDCPETWWERQQKESEKSFKVDPDKRKYFL